MKDYNNREMPEQPKVVLSDKCEPVSEWPVTVALCRTKAAPLGKSSGAVDLEVIALGEASVLIEMVVNGGVDRDELMQTSRSADAQLSSLSFV
jgi:hypothetical protein